MDTAELKKEAIALRKEKHQMIKTAMNADMKNGHDLAIVYTPGVPHHAWKSRRMKTCPWK